MRHQCCPLHWIWQLFIDRHLQFVLQSQDELSNQHDTTEWRVIQFDVIHQFIKLLTILYHRSCLLQLKQLLQFDTVCVNVELHEHFMPKLFPIQPLTILLECMLPVCC
jgi:hypothetical protein